MVDRYAPVVVDTQIDIAALPATVWAALTDVDRWTAWSPLIDEAWLDSPLAVGPVINWRRSGLTFASTLVTVGQDRAFGCDGIGQGIRGLHDWRFEPMEDGARVFVSESMSGGAVSADPAKPHPDSRLEGLSVTMPFSLSAGLRRAAAASR